MGKLNEILVSQSREHDICVDGFKKISQLGKEDLVAYYMSIPDWCMERDFPDLQTLKNEFADCEDKGLFISKVFHGERLNDLQTYIFHNCTGKIRVGLNIAEGTIPMLYVCNGCTMEIVGDGNTELCRGLPPTVVPIYSFGDNCITAKDNAFVTFRKYQNKIL